MAQVRVFKYGDHTIPDPGSQYTIKQVRQSLVAYFPELAKATHTTKKVGGRTEITFQKQTTTKGQSMKDKFRQLHKQRLAKHTQRVKEYNRKVLEAENEGDRDYYRTAARLAQRSADMARRGIQRNC